MFEVSSPTLISTHPTDTLNGNGSWLQSLGDGKFSVILRGETSSNIKTVVFTIDDKGNYTLGNPVSDDLEGVGTFANSFTLAHDHSKAKTLVFLAVYGVVVIGYTGLVPSVEKINTLTLSRGPAAGAATAGAIYIPSEQSFLLFCTDLSSDDRAQVIKLNGDDTLTEYAPGDLILSAGLSLAYPGGCTGAAVGSNGDVVYCVQTQNYDPYETKMVFIRVTVNGGVSVVSAQFQGTDTDGFPMSIAGDTDNNRFVVRYADSSTYQIKLVYGELSGEDSLILGIPYLYDAGVTDQYIWASYGSSVWQKGTNNFVSFIPHSSDVTDVITSSVDNFEVIPDFSSKIALNYEENASASIAFDESLNQAIIGIFGDGGTDFPLADRVYTLTAEGDPVAVEAFWKNHTKQRLFPETGLQKIETRKVIPGKAGQPYIPPTPALPARTAKTVKTQQVCERVA